MINILILDDDESINQKIAVLLTRKGYHCLTASTPTIALETLEKYSVDILITDLVMPEMNGLKLQEIVKEHYPNTEVILISGEGDMDTVIEALHNGAIDFIKKPFSSVDLYGAIERSAKYISLQKEYRNLENQESISSLQLDSYVEKTFVGQSKAILEVYEMAKIAASDNEVSILITGENGTGKEVLARVIHKMSARTTNPFVPINMAAIPENLLESEFFGHLKGAFTGAIETKKGFFELAHTGTLFMDEITETPFPLQSKLLRVLEDRRIRKIGSDKETVIDVRIISASNANLASTVDSNKFRRDLYHRINTFHIHIPPLRERPEDIELLMEHFITHFVRTKQKTKPKISKALLNRLSAYSFPGNVRELKNMIERAMILHPKRDFESSLFLPQETVSLQAVSDMDYNIERNEIRLIQQALEKTGNNKQEASLLLGIPRYTLIRKLQKRDT